MAEYGFAKSKRLLEAADFQAVFDNAPIKASNQHLLLLARPSQTVTARVGLVVSKKNVRRAVQRNRIKRVVRESFRQLPCFPPLDTVVLVRRGADGLNNSELRSALDKLWQQLQRRAEKHSA